MTDAVVVVRVQASSPAPVFRASAEFASLCRLGSGQECFGPATAAWQVESVSGTGLAGAAGFLGLVALGGAQQEPGTGSGISEHDYDNSKGDNGTKPMNPWDFRTSGPPG